MPCGRQYTEMGAEQERRNNGGRHKSAHECNSLLDEGLPPPRERPHVTSGFDVRSRGRAEVVRFRTSTCRRRLRGRGREIRCRPSVCALRRVAMAHLVPKVRLSNGRMFPAIGLGTWQVIFAGEWAGERGRNGSCFIACRPLGGARQGGAGREGRHRRGLQARRLRLPVRQ